LQNKPGALEAVSAIATKHGVNILSGSHDAPPTSDHAAWSFFADLTNSNQSPEQLAKEFASLPGTLDVKFRTASNFIVDTFHFPILAGNEEVLVLASRSVAAIFRRVREMLGAGAAASVLLHQIGRATGKTNFELMVSKIGEDRVRNAVEEVASL
jgi:hypothetical protein